MEISENDLWILSYYRESELAGALIMGRLAGETGDDELRVHLTSHCAEEAHHAWLWTETIRDLGGAPRKVSQTYQSRYHQLLGQPGTVLEVLALTQVFERRVVKHFRAHARWPGTHPRIVKTLERMIADEAGHIGWVRGELDRRAARGERAEVAALLARYGEVDQRVYADVMAYRDRMVDLVGRPVSRFPENGGGLKDELRTLIAGRTGVPEGRVGVETTLHDLGTDSLDLVSLVMAIEERYRVEFEPSDFGTLRTFGDLVRRIDELLKKGEPAL